MFGVNPHIRTPASQPQTTKRTGVRVTLNRKTREINVIADTPDQLKPVMLHLKKNGSILAMDLADKKIMRVNPSDFNIRWRVRT